MEKECPSTPSTTSSGSAPPSPALYPVPPRRKRRPKGLITKPSIPDLPRISEEPRMSLEPRASVSASVHSRPGTVVGLSGVQGSAQGGGELGRDQPADKGGAVKREEKEEVMNT